MNKLFKDLLEITNEVAEKATPVIQNTVNSISEISKDYIQKASDNIERRKEGHDKEFDDILNVYLDQYQKDCFFDVYDDERIKYVIYETKPLFSKPYYQLQEKDGFIIARSTLERNAQRHIGSENNPIDFHITLGTEPFKIMRTCKNEPLTRSYLFHQWTITRQMMSSDFLIKDRNDNVIGKILYQGTNGCYKVKIKHIKDEIMIMIILMCLLSEYTK